LSIRIKCGLICEKKISSNIYMGYRTKPSRYTKSKPRKTIKKTAKLSKPMILAVKKIANRQMNKVVESKVGDYSIEPAPILCFYHNSPMILDNNMLYLQQGVTDEEIQASRNRIGDSVYSKNIQLKLLITNFQTRPNLLYRISVVKVKDNTVTFPSGSLIYGHPQCGNMILAPIDTELPGLVSVEYDRVFDSRAYQTAQDGNEDKKFYWTHNVKVNRKIRYDNASSDPSTCTYRLIVTCYDSQVVLITDNVARFTYFRRHHFLDA